MARTRRRVALAMAAAAMLALAAPADALRRLQVEALTMRTDRGHVAIGEVFHLAIRVRVRESVAALDELVVPDLGALHLDGDERHVTRSAGGTDVVETLTLEATAGGRYTVRGAYLDAIDARSGKPTRFSADPVTIVVDAPGGLSYGGAYAIWHAVLEALVALLAIAAAGVVLFALFVRRRPRARNPEPAPAPIVAAPPKPAQTPRDRVVEAMRAYRSAPSDASLIALRAALFAVAGVQAGATLRDALRAARDERLRPALVAAERAAFGPASARDGAVTELLRAIEAWLG